MQDKPETRAANERSPPRKFSWTTKLKVKVIRYYVCDESRQMLTPSMVFIRKKIYFVNRTKYKYAKNANRNTGKIDTENTEP